MARCAHPRVARGVMDEIEASVANEPLQPDTPPEQGESEREGEPARATEDPQEDPRYVGATPPGYDWPTHGGYLGCLLAVMFACLLAPLGYIVVGFLGAFLAGPLGGLGVAIAIGVTVIGYVAIFIGLARLGWSMGKRFLREYPQPEVRRVWGPDENAVVVDADTGPIVDADQPSPEDASGEEGASSSTP